MAGDSKSPSVFIGQKLSRKMELRLFAVTSAAPARQTWPWRGISKDETESHSGSCLHIFVFALFLEVEPGQDFPIAFRELVQHLGHQVDFLTERGRLSGLRRASATRTPTSICTWSRRL